MELEYDKCRWFPQTENHPHKDGVPVLAIRRRFASGVWQECFPARGHHQYPPARALNDFIKDQAAAAQLSASAGIPYTDALRQVEALSHGFKLVNKAEALARAELVICSTGNGSLDISDLQALRPGAMLASVTSADDEFAFSLAQLPWPSEEVCPHVLALTRPDGSTIFLLNRGEAVNFVHGAVIGEYVYLVLAEIIEGVHQLAHQASTPGLHELPQATMQRIARHWLTDFHGVTP